MGMLRSYGGYGGNWSVGTPQKRGLLRKFKYIIKKMDISKFTHFRSVTYRFCPATSVIYIFGNLHYLRNLHIPTNCCN